MSDYLVDTLALAEVHNIFGNPGTTELPLLEACRRMGHPRYVVGLNELACVGMADGFARLQRTLGVVNLHVAPGLGNGMGMIYTAAQAHTPLLVLVGGQDQRHIHNAPVLDGPLRDMASPVAKAVFTMSDAESASFQIRQSIRTALTPPYGPVVLICPMDVMMQETDAVPETVRIPRIPGIDDQDAEELVRAITSMNKPAIIVTDEVYWEGADSAVEMLAESLNGAVFVAPYTGVLPVSTGIRSFRGYLPPNRSSWSTILSEYDGLIMFGGKGLRPTLYSLGKLPHKKVWVGMDSSLAGIDGEFMFSSIANIETSLQTLLPLLKTHSPHQHGVANDDGGWSAPVLLEQGGLHPSTVIDTLVRGFTHEVLIDESGLATTDVRARMERKSGRYFSNGSGGIGWGVPAMIGAMFARPDEQIVGIIGDGSMLYASEAMWTARHWNLTNGCLVVLNNGRYQTLDYAAKLLGADDELSEFSIGNPSIDFRGLAQAYGWTYLSVTEDVEELHTAIATIKNDRTNVLLDVSVSSANPVTAEQHF